MTCAAGLSRLAGMGFFGKGVPGVGFAGDGGFVAVAGSRIPVAGKPNVAKLGQAAMSEKFPPFSATVGTRALLVVPEICLFHSWDQKKKILSFLIGPPMVYPKSLRRSSFLMQGVLDARQPDLTKVLNVFKASLRPK